VIIKLILRYFAEQTIKKNNMNTGKRLQKKAVFLFDSFNSNKISIDSFEICLITLSTEFVEKGFWDKKLVEDQFIPCLKEQFIDYKNGNLNLLSSTIEGSLLQNFKYKLVS